MGKIVFFKNLKIFIFSCFGLKAEGELNSQ